MEQSHPGRRQKVCVRGNVPRPAQALAWASACSCRHTDMAHADRGMHFGRQQNAAAAALKSSAIVFTINWHLC